MLPIALALAVLGPLAAPQKRLVENTYDRVVLKDGKEVEGRVVYEDDELVVVRGRKDREIPRADVQEVRSVERSLKSFLEKVSALGDPNDVAAVEEIASFCAENGLPDEAKLVHLYVLTRDPENEAAWSGLGGRKAAKGWELKDGNRWRDLDEFRKEHSTWKDALELRSTHFVLQSDLSLEESLRAILTLEEVYATFYGALTPQLKLYAIDEQPLVQITKDRKSYPTPPVPRDAWFFVTTNTLNVCAEGELDTRLVIRELTQALIYNAFNNTLRKDGQVAPWVRKGIADWFAGGAKEGPLRVQIDLSQLDEDSFRRFAQAKEPLSLKRLLTLQPMEFESGSTAENASDAAYTLLAFLARGADGKYRKGLLDFVLSSYNGQGSPTHFQKLVAKDLDALEKEWTAWVREQANG